MDHPHYCRGDCTSAAIQTADGGWLCQGCGLSLEARKAKCRVVVVYNEKTTRPTPPVLSSSRGRTTERPPAPAPREIEKPPLRTMPCSTCSKGQVGVARWESGIKSCTTCQPLRIVAIGVNKAAEVFALEATPDQVASGRRRP